MMITPASIVIGIALIIATTPFIIGPPLGRNAKLRLLSPKKRKIGEAINPVLSAIRDLDVDYRAGIINPEDYQLARSQLLKQAEQYYTEQSQKKSEAVEKLISQRKEQNQSGEQRTCLHCEATVKVEDRFCTSCGGMLNLTCPNCQTPIHSSARFCSNCGEPL